MEHIVRRDLTSSRRFGTNLASVLDRYVYHNGLTGVDGRSLLIEYVDCVCDEREGRENRAEAEAIRAYIRSNGLKPQETIVLTPYTGQTRLLRNMLGRRFRDSVMTVHGSQGREWDTVILSIADGRVESREVPLRFTGSSTDVGRRLINTAVSRAKRRLVVFCDVDFWMSMDDELVTGVIKEGKRVEWSPR